MADNRQYVQGIDYSLSGSGITSSATSITLASLKTADGTLITMSDFGALGYMTLEPETSKEENISFTGITQNANGTATLTTVVRGLGYVAPYTAVSALQVAHSGGTTVRIANSAPFYNELANKRNDETMTQTWTFTNPEFPRIDVDTTDPTDDEEFATKGYVDRTAGGAAVSKDREVVAGNAGETLVAGNWVFLDPADSEWKKTDASVSATTDDIKIGVAQGAGVDGGAISGGVLISGLDTNQTGMTANAIQFLSDTAGEITNSAGTVRRAVGIATSTTQIIVDTYFNDYVTGNENDALVGNNGTPATANLYVTQTGFQRSQEVFAADGEASDTYVITLSPVPAAYITGMVLNFSANTANTGAATLNVNSLGAITIKKLHDQDLADGDIESGQIVTVVYDGTNFQMQSQIGSLTQFNRLIEAETAEVAVTSTTTETTIYEKSIPANTLSTSNAVRVRVYLTDLRSTATGDVTFRLKYGSTTVATIIAITNDSISTSIDGYVLEGIIAANAATNAQIAFLFGIGSNRSTGLNGLSSGEGGQGTAVEDSTGALNITVTAQWSATSASNDVQKSFATLEILNT